jgi:hypothetical protein
VVSVDGVVVVSSAGAVATGVVVWSPLELPPHAVKIPSEAASKMDTVVWRSIRVLPR